jgi:tight adherence protein B
VPLALLVFLAVTSGLVGGYLVLSGYFQPDASRVRRRLTDEFAKDQPKIPPSTLYKNLDPIKLEPGQTFFDPLGPERTAPRSTAKPGARERLNTLLEQANLALTVNQLSAACATLGFLLGGLGTWLGGLPVGLAMAAVGAVVPLLYVHGRRKARREKYLRQLPGAFDLMARVIRAGQSVPQAFQAVAETFEDPLAGEFAMCQKQQSLGLRPELCFQELMERSGIVEMRIFAMAIVIQRQSGGNLSDMLERLAGLVRARLRLCQQVRTLTAEGRMQGWTLVVLPFLVFAVMLGINRAYAEVLLGQKALLAAMLTLMGLGILWIRRIVNFEG